MSEHDDHQRVRSPLLRLRHGVDDLHHALERRLDLLADPLDPQRYADALVALECVLGTVELALADDRVWSSCRLTPLLLDDMRDLGRAPSAPVAVEGLDVAGAAWGARYVIEGSRLGATVVEPHLAAVLPSAPRRYFGAAAIGAASRWGTFRAAAGDALAGTDDIDAAVAAARHVFRSLLDAVERSHDERELVPVGAVP